LSTWEIKKKTRQNKGDGERNVTGHSSRKVYGKRLNKEQAGKPFGGGGKSRSWIAAQVAV